MTVFSPSLSRAGISLYWPHILGSIGKYLGNALRPAPDWRYLVPTTMWSTVALLEAKDFRPVPMERHGLAVVVFYLGWIVATLLSSISAGMTYGGGYLKPTAPVALPWLVMASAPQPVVYPLKGDDTIRFAPIAVPLLSTGDQGEVPVITNEEWL